jgi:hypothetical protein
MSIGTIARDKVAVLLSRVQRPTLAFFDQRITSEFVYQGELFAERKCDDWIGFYDWWLAAETGEVVRLDLIIDDPNALDLEYLANLIGAKIKGTADEMHHKLLVTFIEHKVIDEFGSILQDFGGNLLYYGNRGSVAIVFFLPLGGLAGVTARISA